MSAPYVAGSDTSKAAAESVGPWAETLRGRIYVFIAHAPDGAICEEVEDALLVSHQTASARIRELALCEALADSGERRSTRSGRQAIVWRAKP
jgi:hypothetical protein